MSSLIPVGSGTTLGMMSDWPFAYKLIAAASVGPILILNGVIHINV